jgi:Fe-S-cluster containining protein
MAKKKSLEIYMAFPDGAYDYVCPECTALCCRGHGHVGLLTSELAPVFERYPALRLTVIQRRGEQLTLATPADGCVVLDTDNRCKIEKEMGYPFKPSICKLFPFNGFRRWGTAVAVQPHFMCPLRLVTPPRPGAVQGTHEILERAIREIGYIEASLPTLDKISVNPSRTPADVLACEIGFRDACTNALGHATFSSVIRGVSTDLVTLDDVVARGSALLEMDLPAASSEPDFIDSMMLALASPVRLNLMLLEPEAMLRALALGEVMLRYIWSTATRPLTPQSASSILEDYLPTVSLIARGDEPLGVPETFGGKLPTFEDPGLVFAGFATFKELGKGRPTLATLERIIAPSLPVHDRALLLHHIGMKAADRLAKSAKRN